MKNKQSIELFSPMTGRVVPLDEVSDEAFAAKILGDGIAVCPRESLLCAPQDGRVDQVFETSHAITLVTEGGAELLLHVGIDTVALKGKYFEMLVAAGQSVKRGDALIRFDMEGIRAAGYDLTTPMIVSNSDDFDLNALAEGDVRAGEPILSLTSKRT